MSGADDVLDEFEPSVGTRVPRLPTVDYSREAVAERKARAEQPVSGAHWPELDPLPHPEPERPKAFPFSAMGCVLGGAALAIARDVQAPDALGRR